MIILPKVICNLNSNHGQIDINNFHILTYKEEEHQNQIIKPWNIQISLFRSIFFIDIKIDDFLMLFNSNDALLVNYILNQIIDIKSQLLMKQSSQIEDHDIHVNTNVNNLNTIATADDHHIHLLWKIAIYTI